MMKLFSRTTKSAGIDLGSCQVKIAIIERDKKGVRLESTYLRALPEGLIVEGQIVDQEGVQSRLQTLLAELDLSKAKTVTGLSGQDTFIKFTKMQRASKE